MACVTHDDMIQNIRFLMNTKWRGFKQSAMAEKCGFGSKEFSNMLNGRKCIQSTDVVRIANALGVTPNDILRPASRPDEDG